MKNIIVSHFHQFLECSLVLTLFILCVFVYFTLGEWTQDEHTKYSAIASFIFFTSFLQIFSTVHFFLGFYSASLSDNTIHLCTIFLKYFLSVTYFVSIFDFCKSNLVCCKLSSPWCFWLDS